MPTMTVELSAGELRVMRKLRNFSIQNITGRSPQAHEIVRLKSRYKTPKDNEEIRDFRRAVAKGAITHSRNGYCWLSTAGEDALNQVPFDG